MKHDMVAKRRATRERLGGYVKSRILPALGVPEGPFELEIPAEGTRSVVLFLHTVRGRYIVKCFTDLIRAAQTALVTRHMVARGAPVPRLLFADLSPLTLLRIGCVVLVEEAVDGRILQELEPVDAELRSAARALARLHSIRRATWGPAFRGLGRRGDYFAFLQGRVRRRLKDVVENSAEFAAAIADPAVFTWFGAQRAAAIQPGGFSLCHLRVTDTNAMVQPDGETRLIDVVTARYGNHSIDLERALYRWCKHVSRSEELFLDEYFRHFTAVSREHWQEHRDYHRASFHLTQAYRAAKEMRKFRELRGERSEKTKRRRRNLVRQLKKMIDVIAGARTAPPAGLMEGFLNSVKRAARTDRARRLSGRSGAPAGSEFE